jgi:predicted regulator of Ras-like GTPase activity (Roadblock/LC7/MglB family)
MMLHQEELQQLQTTSDRLAHDATALAVLVIDRLGQSIVNAGSTDDLDVTSLASLFAGNVSTTSAIAKLLREREFAGQYHEGEHTHAHVSLFGERGILVVLFDRSSSLGLVRLRSRRASEDLQRIFAAALEKARTMPFGANSELVDITDDDIDQLLADA